MTLLIGKQCKDGVLFLADGISISEKPGSPPIITTGAVKALCSEKSGRSYCMVFGGLAGLDTTRPTFDWLREAASKQDGSLQDNAERAAWESLRDAVKNGFGKNDEQQRIELMNHGSIVVFVSVRPDEWWEIDAFYDSSEKNRIRPGFVVISLTGNSLGMQELQPLLNHEDMTWREAVISCSRVFDKAAELFPERCRYPGTLCVQTLDGCVRKTFNSVNELMGVAER